MGRLGLRPPAMTTEPNRTADRKPPMWRGTCLRMVIPLRFSLSPYLLLFLFFTSASADEQGDYVKQIKPLLRERCYACHGALKQEGGLRLDTVALAIRGGDSGSAITPGDAKSRLLTRVMDDDPSQRMPPEGEPLKADQIESLQRWIAENAPAPADEVPESDPRDHWAFRAPIRPEVPAVANPTWVRNPIDAFLAQQHEQHGLTPQPEASRALLLRRLSIDLIGLPPTLDEIHAFEADTSPDWYEKAVTRLLDDERHGERWARHWMDVWRYSDWWGLGDELRNSQKHIWHWRDWIVESLNEDLAYAEMIRQMLAADELYPNDLQKLRATGFLARNWVLFSRLQWMDDTVEHVGKGLLGLTLNCAKCHDHKYDPIEQADYYRMRAFFEPYHVRMDMVPGQVDLSQDGIPRVFDGLIDAPTHLYVRGDETKPDLSTVIAPGVPRILAFKTLAIQPVALPQEAWQPERREWVLNAYVDAARNKVDVAARDMTSARDRLAVAKKRSAEASQTVTPPVDQPTGSNPQNSSNPAASTSPSAESDGTSQQAADVAQQELTVAELALTVATSELLSTESRCAALRATWATDDASGNVAAAQLRRVAKASAIRAAREAGVAKARHAVALVELRQVSANAEAKAGMMKELETARESLNAATSLTIAPIADADQVASFAGAKWTTTRFVHPNKDDAPISFPSSSSGRRTALADWITDPRNPLTARVAVNHVWSRHMGTPMTPSPFDFGRKSAPPVNPELIDWLASEFVEQGWSMKHLHRLIVSSAAYRMGSSEAGGEANLARDPDNHRWWKRNSVRIEAQAVRDSILSLTGNIDLTQGGPPVSAADQATSNRRSLYFLHSDKERNPFLTTFDDADVRECYRRDQSIVPQQALALSNSGLVLSAAQKIADRLGSQIPESDDREFVLQAFRGILCTAPNDAEWTACVNTMVALRQQPGTTHAQARGHLVWVLLNHNDFVTLR